MWCGILILQVDMLLEGMCKVGYGEAGTKVRVQED
jgi:hypothetical protein